MPEKRKQHCGAITIQTGLILIIDPCLLFDETEWTALAKKVLLSNPPPHPDGSSFLPAIMEALAEKLKNPNIKRDGVLIQTYCGDGEFPVTPVDGHGILIDDLATLRRFSEPTDRN